MCYSGKAMAPIKQYGSKFVAIWIKICCNGYNSDTDGDSDSAVILIIILY